MTKCNGFFLYPKPAAEAIYMYIYIKYTIHEHGIYSRKLSVLKSKQK